MKMDAFIAGQREAEVSSMRLDVNKTKETKFKSFVLEPYKKEKRKEQPKVEKIDDK